MRKISPRSLVLTSLALTGVALAWWAAVSSSTESSASVEPVSGAAPQSAAAAASAAVTSATTAPATAKATAKPAATKPQPSLFDTAVTADFHPHVASVVEAHKTGMYPERLSLFVDPKPFDPAAFAADPQSYLNVVEPARVYQVAQPGPGVQTLMSGNESLIEVPHLGQTTLSVRGQAGAPVSWVIFDGGRFENGLACTTVRADDQGVATVTYTATPGTADRVNVLAGSPMTSGTVTLMINVTRRTDAPAADTTVSAR